MNRLTHQKITITLPLIGLILLVLSIKPILSHSGHNHNQPESKSTKIEPEKTKIPETEIPSYSTPEAQASQKADNKTINVTLQKSKQFNLIPQPSEIIFLLLVANPIILKIIKQKLDKQESL